MKTYMFLPCKTKLILLLFIGMLVSIFVSCTSTVQKSPTPAEVSNNTDILLFTLGRDKNPFLVDDVDFDLDRSDHVISLNLKLSDLRPNSVINAKTKFVIDLAIPNQASIVINGKIIRDQNTIMLHLAQGFFTGRSTPMIIIAENRTNQRTYTISSTFEKPTFSFRYSKRKYRIKTKQTDAAIKAPTVRGSASGNIAYRISPVDNYVTLAANGALLLNSDPNAQTIFTRDYTIGARRQGVRFRRRVNITIYPNQAPKPATLVYPEDYQREVDRNQDITLEWMPATDPDGDPLSYRVLVYSNSNLFTESSLNTLYTQQSDDKADFIIHTTVTKPTYAINYKDLRPDTLYYWKVITSDGYSEVESATFHFTTIANQIPSEASLITPASNASIDLGTQQTTSFTWSVSTDDDKDIVKYFFFLSSDLKAIRRTIRASILEDDPAKETNILRVVTLKTNAYTLSHNLLAPNTTYYWTVKATDGFSERIAAINEFTTVYTGDSITIIAPFNNSERINTRMPINLEWTKGPTLADLAQPITYNLYISSNERAVVLARTNVLLAKNLSTNQYTLTKSLATKTTYYWKVDGFYTKKAGENATKIERIISPLYSFTTTNHTPTRPILNYPVKAMNSVPRINGVLLSWENSIDLDHDEVTYNVYLSSSEEDLLLNDQQLQIAQEILAADYLLPPENLAPLTQYYWKVEAYDGKDAISSAIYSFTTSTNLTPKAPIPLSPIRAESAVQKKATEITYENGVTFIWSLPTYIEGDEFYTVAVSTNLALLTEIDLNTDTVLTETNLDTNIFVSEETSRYRLTLSSDLFLPKTKYFWRVFVRDPSGKSTVSTTAQFQTKGFSLRLNRQRIAAENPNDFFFTIRLDQNIISEKNTFSYRYTLVDKNTNTPDVTGEGMITASNQNQPLNIRTLVSEALKLKVEILANDSQTVLETFTRTIQQEPFIKITTPERLAQIGKNANFPLSAVYTLMNNLNLANVTLEPIGNDENPFTGIFYGQKLTISNVNMNRGERESTGLFGTIKNATISDLTLRTGAVGIKGGNFTGGIAGKITGNSRIKNVTFRGNIAGKEQTGGIAGRINGKTVVTDVESYGKVTGSDTVGGIGGRVYSGVTITNAKTYINVTGRNDVGGIVGRGIDIGIEYSSAQNKVEGRLNTGGIAGSLVQSSIRYTSSRTSVKGTRKVGGIAGWLSDSDILNSYAISDINGFIDVGGIVGYTISESKINDTYSESKIRGRSNVGGITGLINGKSFISNSYVRGAIIPTLSQRTNEKSDHFGGIVGFIDGPNTLENNFYSFVSIEPIKSAKIVLTEEKERQLLRNNKGLDVPALKNASTFNAWDLQKVWQLNSDINNGFPFLRGNRAN